MANMKLSLTALLPVALAVLLLAAAALPATMAEEQTETLAQQVEREAQLMEDSEDADVDDVSGEEEVDSLLGADSQDLDEDEDADDDAAPSKAPSAPSSDDIPPPPPGKKGGKWEWLKNKWVWLRDQVTEIKRKSEAQKKLERERPIIYKKLIKQYKKDQIKKPHVSDEALMNQYVKLTAKKKRILSVAEKARRRRALLDRIRAKKEKKLKLLTRKLAKMERGLSKKKFFKLREGKNTLVVAVARARRDWKGACANSLNLRHALLKIRENLHRQTKKIRATLRALMKRQKTLRKQGKRGLPRKSRSILRRWLRARLRAVRRLARRNRRRAIKGKKLLRMGRFRTIYDRMMKRFTSMKRKARLALHRSKNATTKKARQAAKKAHAAIKAKLAKAKKGLAKAKKNAAKEAKKAAKKAPYKKKGRKDYF